MDRGKKEDRKGKHTIRMLFGMEISHIEKNKYIITYSIHGVMGLVGVKLLPLKIQLSFKTASRKECMNKMGAEITD